MAAFKAAGLAFQDRYRLLQALSVRRSRKLLSEQNLGAKPGKHIRPGSLPQDSVADQQDVLNAVSATPRFSFGKGFLKKDSHSVLKNETANYAEHSSIVLFHSWATHPPPVLIKMEYLC